MGRRGLLAAGVALALAGCTDANLSAPEGLGPEASSYLSAALDVMEFNSIRRHEIDWAAFRETTFTDAGDAKTAADTYPAIEWALLRIGDNHSFFRAPDASGPAGSPVPSGVAPADPTAAVIGSDIGYLDVPAFSGGGPEGDEVARLYHSLLGEVDALDVCRWVVDLRGNTGGNMWPMLAGVGPILGEDTVGFFVDPDSIVDAWQYRDGEALLGGAVVAAADLAYRLERPSPSVALLTDSLTASSGEAMAVAFRGRDDTRSFGEPTFGVSTANTGFGLADGAMIFLTTAWMADRGGTIHGGRLNPDSLVSGAKTGDRSTDAALDAALDWLEAIDCG